MRGMLGNLQISFISAISMHGVLMAMIGKCGFHFVCDRGVKIYQLDPSYGLTARIDV